MRFFNRGRFGRVTREAVPRPPVETLARMRELGVDVTFDGTAFVWGDIRTADLNALAATIHKHLHSTFDKDVPGLDGIQAALIELREARP